MTKDELIEAIKDMPGGMKVFYLDEKNNTYKEIYNCKKVDVGEMEGKSLDINSHMAVMDTKGAIILEAD
jgi:hypothetical protein